MAEIGESTLHMLNPYKFATWQFMKQYFSVSPSMYLEFPSYTLTNRYSYNELLYRTIMPFEAKFQRNAGAYQSTVNIDGTTCTQDWAYNNIPFKYCLPRDFHNLRNTSDSNTDKYISSGNKGEVSDGTIINAPFKSKENTDNYFFTYHGGIFAAVIPNFNLNKVLLHQEIIPVSYNSRSYDVATPNFFSTYTRTRVPQLSSSYNHSNNLGVNVDSSLSGTPTNYNSVFASTGVYPNYYGTRRTSYNGSVSTNNLPSYQTYYNSYRSHQCWNQFNFVCSGPGEPSETAIFKILYKIMTNSSGTPSSVRVIEADMIYGMSYHNITMMREPI